MAVGGDLTVEWLLAAYRRGIFPWFNDGEPILWWTPNPRSVLFIDALKVRRSLIKTIRKQHFTVTFDTNFKGVMARCAETPRPGQNGTWISEKMVRAYTQLHQLGFAHSVEVWHQKELVGGLYGVAIGKVFFGESMFAKMSDASKVALVALCQQLQAWGFRIIDTQMGTEHLKSMGARLISREHFESLLAEDTLQDFPPQPWQLDPDWDHSFFPTGADPAK